MIFSPLIIAVLAITFLVCGPNTIRIPLLIGFLVGGLGLAWALSL